MENDPEELLTANQVCRLLKISRRTFARLRQTNRLPPPIMHWSRTSMRWRRGDIGNFPIESVGDDQRQRAFREAAKHAQAAAQASKDAATHASAAANALRWIAAGEVIDAVGQLADAPAICRASDMPIPEGAD